MAAEPSVVEVALESDLKNVEVADELSRRVTTRAGFDEEDRQRIEMAVHESTPSGTATRTTPASESG